MFPIICRDVTEEATSSMVSTSILPTASIGAVAIDAELDDEVNNKIQFSIQSQFKHKIETCSVPPFRKTRPRRIRRKVK